MVGSYTEERSHLVDECAGAACAGAVHTLLDSACEEDYLRVLAAQLDNSISVRLLLLDSEKCSVDLLYEGYLRRIRKPETCRACDAHAEFSVRIVRLYQL